MPLSRFFQHTNKRASFYESLCHGSLNENRQQKSNPDTDKSVQPNLIMIFAKQLKSTCTLVELFKRSEVLS